MEIATQEDASTQALPTEATNPAPTQGFIHEPSKHCRWAANRLLERADGGASSGA